MRKNIFAVFMLLLIFSGCATSQKSTFYRLSPLVDAALSINRDCIKQKTVSIGPVYIPDNIRRPQLVIITDTNEIKICEFDRWVGNLGDEIASVLNRDIASLTGSKNIVAHELGRRIDTDYQIMFDIGRFDGTPGKGVKLEAGWMITTDRGKKKVLLGRSDINETTQGDTLEDMVVAMNRALVAMSGELARALATVCN